MHRHERHLEETLTKIAALASDAVNGGQSEEEEEYKEEEEEEEEEGETADPGCTIKSVPNRLLVKAAETAVKINPVNGLMFGRVADLAPGLPQDPARLAVLVQKYWGPTPRRLSVSFMDSTPADLRRRIISHLNAWTRTGCIEFVYTQGVGQVRISRGPGGYYSYLGTDVLLIPRNRQTMNLQGFTMTTPEREFKRVIRHEAGHTLGFPHEHMRRQLIARLDREKTYEYFLRTQGWDRATVDAQVLTPLEESSIFGTVHADQDSIMCYQLPGSITRDGQAIRGGTDINRLDYAFCGRIYPRRGRAAETVSTVADEQDWPETEDVAEVAA
jgi:Astacin (Peptidase family M12A)